MRVGARFVAPLAGAAIAAAAIAGCGGGDDAAQQPKGTRSCPSVVPEPTMVIPASSIYLNIVNASDKSGLAAKTAVQLGWRGFHVLDTGNQSVMDNRKAPKSAEIRYGSTGRQIALTLASQVKNAQLVKLDDRADPTVDLVLGNAFALVPVPPPAAGKVTVNVFNTTYRSGLSGEVAADLKKRGFVIGENGNDPLKKFLPETVVQIRHGERGEPYARRVQLQFTGAQLVQDGRKGTDVDVAIGNKFSTLVPAAQATPSTSAPAPRLPGC